METTRCPHLRLPLVDREDLLYHLCEELLHCIVSVHLEVDYFALEGLDSLDLSFGLPIEELKAGIQVTVVLVLDDQVGELALADLLVD